MTASVVIWIILAYVFIKCLGWVFQPFFRRPEEEYIEEPQTIVNINVQITDSYNTDHSVLKGGAYYGIEKTNEKTDTEDDYFTKYFGSQSNRGN